MGYNPNCTEENCPQQCCNSHGNCPDLSYTQTAISKCKYYYSSGKDVEAAEIAAAVIAPLIGLFFIVLLIFFCKKKCKEGKYKKQSEDKNTADKDVNNPYNMTNQYFDTKATQPNQLSFQTNEQVQGSLSIEHQMQPLDQPQIVFSTEPKLHPTQEDQKAQQNNSPQKLNQ